MKGANSFQFPQLKRNISYFSASPYFKKISDLMEISLTIVGSRSTTSLVVFVDVTSFFLISVTHCFINPRKIQTVCCCSYSLKIAAWRCICKTLQVWFTNARIVSPEEIWPDQRLEYGSYKGWTRIQGLSFTKGFLKKSRTLRFFLGRHPKVSTNL